MRDIVPEALADLLRDQPMSQAKLDVAWRATVGPALARASRVWLEDRILRVETPGPLWAAEIARAGDELVARLARLLGTGVVARLAIHAPGAPPDTARRPPTRADTTRNQPRAAAPRPSSRRNPAKKRP